MCNVRQACSVCARQLMFFRNPLEAFRRAFDLVGDFVVVLDRQLAHDLVGAARTRRPETRVIVDFRADRISMRHGVRPPCESRNSSNDPSAQRSDAKTPGTMTGR